VAAIDSDVDYVSAPANYADFFTMYWDYTINLLRQFGIGENDLEDSACEIMLRFMERGSLAKFDPDLCFYYKGEMRPARFRSYYSRAVEMYSRGLRDKQKKLSHREFQICDIHFTAGNHSSNNIDVQGGGKSSVANWAETYGEANPDHSDEVLDMMVEESEADAVRRMLAQVPPRNAQDRCDLVALYDAVRVQILTYGEYDIGRLRERFGVSSTALHSWMWFLKQNLAVIYGKPVPPKRPRRVRRPVLPTVDVPACDCRNPDCPGQVHP
jgi:hypothetical protein